MFGAPRSTRFPAWQSRARALEHWREAAALVETRWRVCREADRVSRAWAYTAFVAALDAEEAAAAEIAMLSPDLAA